MVDTKQVAKHALRFIGGTPKVYAYYNDNKSKTVDIATFYNGYLRGKITTSTLGFSSRDTGLVVDEHPLRVELMAAADKEYDGDIQHILSSAAFEIMDGIPIGHGMIVDNIIQWYIPNSQMKHCLFVTPQYWSKYTSYFDNSTYVAWLCLIPISDVERMYIKRHGFDAFDKIMERRNINIFDLNRSTIV